ncbi:MAG: protein-L-isoaspartate O-methyltransferase [Bradyrhizobiaceae bacterium]|nr:MAG: protein-L-isoaspartate O-methyltransferase [Bradyrhizobiaceae bacterium]
MSDMLAARQKMVDGQVRPSDVTDLRIIEAMMTVPREAFVPRDRQALAYLDIDIDVAAPGKPKAYLIKPAVLARMLQAAEITAADRVLVAGCAPGYAAAVIAKFAGAVVECDPEKPAEGRADKGPYDVIVLDGATEIVPQTLYNQLKMDGRLVGVFAITQPPRATLVTRSPADFGSRPLFDASAPVLPGLERLPAFAF